MVLAAATRAWLLESLRGAPTPQACANARAIGAALRRAGYTSRAIGERILRGTPVVAAAAPTQVLRRAATAAAPARRDEVDALIALFALGLPVDRRELPTSYETLAPLLIEDDEIRARCMVVPVGALQDAGADLYVTTDWPPEKRRDEEPCMYLGPDSLALADIASKLATHKRVADLCAGSGVQGLVAARAGALSIEWVEPQSRAAAFCRLNAALNGVPGRVVEARVDAVDGSQFDLILANPPYVATPALAYDAFADGGLDGYDVLCDVVEYASLNLASEGLLACVFELNGPPEALFAKLEAAWTTGGARCALIHDTLNERTSPAAAAARRGGDAADAWLANYEDRGVDRVANAILLLGRSGGGFEVDVEACARAWAPPPTNVEARRAVARAVGWVSGV